MQEWKSLVVFDALDLLRSKLLKVRRKDILPFTAFLFHAREHLAGNDKLLRFLSFTSVSLPEREVSHSLLSSHL